MTTIRPGNYITFLGIGKHTFQDNLKFIFNDSQIKIERIRRKFDSKPFKKFNKWERNTLDLTYLDENNKHVGGVLKVVTNEFNFSQLALHSYNQYGYFTDDKIVFGKFAVNQELTIENTKLLEITKENLNSTDVIIRHTFELIDNVYNYKIDINPNLIDSFHEDVSANNESNTISSELVPQLPFTFTEKLFYNFRNNKI